MAQEIRNVRIVPEGDGVDVKRLFPLNDLMNFDPFVLWDHFNISPGHGFPDHPHRGFEAITYMFKGGMHHKDNLGNESFVSAGGAQKFTAGRGLVHSEMPADKGNSNGIQLWINLPQRLKKIDPAYQQINAETFPVKKIKAGQVKILVGENSPLKLNTEVIYQHITLHNKGRYQLDIHTGLRGIVYIIKGSIKINQETVTRDQACLIDEMKKINFLANEDSEFMVCMGKPHHEPIRQYGPFVD